MSKYPEDSIEAITEKTGVNRNTAQRIYTDYAQSEVMPTLDTEAIEAVRLNLMAAYPDRSGEFERLNLNEITTRQIIERFRG